MLDTSIDAILGQEFLTWLWYQSDVAPDSFKDKKGEPFSVSLEQRVVVEGGNGDAREVATVTGNMSPLLEARFGLLKGKKVTRATLRLEKEELFFQFTLRAEDFSFSALKTPKIEKTDDDPDAMVLEKFFLIEQPLRILEDLYSSFIRLRLSPAWNEEVPQIQAWMTRSG